MVRVDNGHVRSLRSFAIASASVAIVAVSLLAGGARQRPASLDQRVDDVAATIRCPACGDLSVADSTSSLAVEMRGSIRDAVRAGRTADQIRAAFVRRYGESILLVPPPNGVDRVARFAPLAALLVGIAALWSIIRRRAPAIGDRPA